MSMLYKKLYSAIKNNNMNEVNLFFNELDKTNHQRNILAFQKKLNAEFVAHVKRFMPSEEQIIMNQLTQRGYVIQNESHSNKRKAANDVDESRAVKKARISERHNELKSSVSAAPNRSSQEFFFSIAPYQPHAATHQVSSMDVSQNFLEKLKKKIANGESLKLFIFYTLNKLIDLDEVAKELNPLLKNLPEETKKNFCKRFLRKTHEIVIQNQPEPGSNEYPFISSYIKLITFNQKKASLNAEQLTNLFAKYDYKTFIAIGDLYEKNSFMSIDNFYNLMMKLDSELILYALKEYSEDLNLITEIFHQDTQRIKGSLEYRCGRAPYSPPTQTTRYQSPSVAVSKKLPPQANITNVQITNYFISPTVQSNIYPIHQASSYPQQMPAIYGQPYTFLNFTSAWSPYSTNPIPNRPAQSSIASNLPVQSNEELYAPRRGMFQAPVFQAPKNNSEEQTHAGSDTCNLSNKK